MKNRKQKNIQFAIIAAIGILLIFVVSLLIGKKYFVFKKYKDKNYGFSLKYPRSWESKPEESGVAVIFLSLLENDLDIFYENVNIVIQSLVGQDATSLEDYTKIAIEQMKAVFKSNIEIVESKPIRFAGRPGYKLVYIGSDPNGSNIKNMHVWTIDGLTAYQFTYSALETKYDKYLFQINQMIKSFKIN